MEKEIIVNDLRNVKANTFSDTNTSDFSPDKPHSGSGRGIASEATRHRRKTCIIVLAVLPFLGASAALGIQLLDGDAIIEADSSISTTLAPSSSSIPQIMPVTTSQPSPSPSVAEQQGGKSLTTSPTPVSSSSHFPSHGNLRSTTLPTLGKSTTSPTLSTTSLAPSSSPNTTRPTFAPSSRPAINLLVDAGNGGVPSTAFPLGECQGDCDGDDDCEV